MKSLLTFAFSLFIFCFAYSAQAQQTITGTITDKTTNEALPAATILVLKTGEGIVTDEKGRFTLNLPEGADSVAVSYIGYETKYLSTQRYRGRYAYCY